MCMPAETDPAERRLPIRAGSDMLERARGLSDSSLRVDVRPVSRGGRSLRPSELGLRVIAVAVAALALSLGVFANPSTAGSLARVPSSSLPACPPASLLTAALHQRLGHATAHLGRIGSITSAGFGPAPTAAPRRGISQYERTCTYARGSVTPITVSFVAPVTSAEFTAARIALSRSVRVVVLRDLGTPAWGAKAGGLLFVLKGSLDVVISASATSVASLTALARDVG